MANSTGLGKGLASLIPQKPKLSNEEKVSSPQTPVTDGVTEISLDSISTNPYQPRKEFEQQALDELVSSIKEHGLLQPLVVSRLDTGKYELIAGERRFRACQVLGKEKIAVVVRSTSKLEKLELALIENIQRRDLNAIERAEAYQKLVDEFSMIQEEVAKRIGKPRAHVANTLRYLNLPGEIQKALAENKITEGHAKVIAGLDSEAEQLKFYKRVVQHSLSVRDLESEVKTTKVRGGNNKINLDPTVIEQQKNLENSLGTKVKINKQNKGGKIVIECYSDEEYVNLVEKLSDLD